MDVRTSDTLHWALRSPNFASTTFELPIEDVERIEGV